jgi:beta-glucosidase
MDGPLAIRQASYASAFPAGLTVAASWDRDLAHLRGQELGMEFKEKGAHVILGPVAGPLGRSGYGGRNWEGFSPDPYLTGELFHEVTYSASWMSWFTLIIVQTIEGLQETGLQACAKRMFIGYAVIFDTNPESDYIGNEQETQRNPSVNEDGVTIEAVSSNIDDRTMHEVYLWPFQNAVKAGVASLMCSYNR